MEVAWHAYDRICMTVYVSWLGETMYCSMSHQGGARARAEYRACSDDSAEGLPLSQHNIPIEIYKYYYKYYYKILLYFTY